VALEYLGWFLLRADNFKRHKKKRGRPMACPKSFECKST
jgi:hypothetical protein